ncbi:MAG: AsmA family protein, partial [Rhodomicrobium sp.]
MGRILATLATILILVLGAAFAVPAFVDWNSYRSGIEKTASAVLGRKVSILGDIDIVLLPEPHLRANNVAAGNGKADGALLTAAAVDVSLSLEALFSGRLDAGKLRLVHPVLTLDFSKPFAEPDADAEDGALPFTAGVRNVEIEGGRISVFSRNGGATEALALTRINGTASAASPGNVFRFNGHISKDRRQYEVKLLAAPHGAGLKLTGSAIDTATKVSMQADGVLTAGQDPDFEGSLALNVPQAAGGANQFPFDLQAKSTARIGLAAASLGDLELTLDPQNRPQVLTGSANIAFGTRTASAALKARSLDADALLNGAAWPGVAASAPGDWSALTAAADNLLWLYPDYTLSLDLEAGQVQLKGEPIEGVKLHGSRTQTRWLFDEALATLPGDTAVKLAGTLTKPA